MMDQAALFDSFFEQSGLCAGLSLCYRKRRDFWLSIKGSKLRPAENGSEG